MSESFESLAESILPHILHSVHNKCRQIFIPLVHNHLNLENTTSLVKRLNLINIVFGFEHKFTTTSSPNII